jgi:hypothetical protein
MTAFPDLGPIQQLPAGVDHIGFVWHEIEPAIERFGKLLGVQFAPPREMAPPLVVERPGGPRELRMRSAQAWFGPIRLEFIQPLGPSIYTEHLERYGEGVHHIGYDARDIPAFLAAYGERGVGFAMHGLLGSGDDTTPFAYFDTYEELGVLTEVVDFSPALRERMRQVGTAGA